MNKKGGGRERYREREIRERQQSVNKWLKRRLGEGEGVLVLSGVPRY